MFIKIMNLIILFKLTQQLMEEQNHLDLNDILNENYMPSTFLFLDGSSLVNVSRENINKNIGNFSNIDGSITKALSTMGYHREMMEKYLCNNFVAERVLTEFSSETFQRRLGLATDEFLNSNHKLPIRSNNNNKHNNIQNAMRFDQGSTAYQNWLSKTTTLDDIHNNMALTKNDIINDSVAGEMDKKEQNSKIDRTQYPRKIPLKRNDQQIIYNNNNGDDYVEGDITGYAIEQPMKENNYQSDIQQHYGNARNQQNNFFQHIAGSKIGQQHSSYYNNLDNDEQNLLYTSNVDGILNTGGFTPGRTTTSAIIDTTTNFNPLLQHFISKKKNLLNNNPIRKFTEHIKNTLFGQRHGGDQYKYGEGYSDSGHEYDEYGVQHTTSDKSSKEMSLKDLFDIALTTLAFLSFGMFILQVIMCVTMTKNDNSMMMMPMEVEEIDMTEEIRRRKRSIRTTNLTELHELTIHILRSIDSAVYAKYDNGKCLQYTICINNKFSRKRKDNQKFWVPIWGLGMSWLSGRVIPKQERSVSIFNGLKASIMGLGNRDCKQLYPCNLRELVNKYKDVYEP